MVDAKNPVGSDFVKALKENISTLLAHCAGGKSKGEITESSEEWRIDHGYIVIINQELLPEEDPKEKDWRALVKKSQSLVEEWGRLDRNQFSRYETVGVEGSVYGQWMDLIDELGLNDPDSREDDYTLPHDKRSLTATLIRGMDLRYFSNINAPPELIDAMGTLPVTRDFSFFIATVQDGGDFGVWDPSEPGFKLYKVINEKTDWTYEAVFDAEEWADLWGSEEQILNECQRVFLRLTERPDGSFVDLWDLIDSRPMAKKNVAYQVIKAVLKETCASRPPPVQYDPETGVFTKDSVAFEAIRSLQKAFLEWGRGDKK